MTLAAASSSHHPAVPLQRSRGDGRLTAGPGRGRGAIRSLFQQGCAKIRVPVQHRRHGMEAVMINSSGGLTGGDRLSWHFATDPHADLTVTSQACERVYKSIADTARVDITLSVGQESNLSWLPQETILFDGGCLDRTLTVDLAPGASVLLVEPLLFGRQAMGETVETGHIRDRWRIRQNGRLIHAEDLLMSGPVAAHLASPVVASGLTACVTLTLIASWAEARADKARALLHPHDGLSFWNGKLVARLLAESGQKLRQKLIPLIETLLPSHHQSAGLPKVWRS